MTIDNKQYMVTDEVSTVPVCEANLNEENRIKFVTDLAAISRGKHESANPPKRYKMLLAEAAPTTIVFNCLHCKNTEINPYVELGRETGLLSCDKCGYVDEPTSKAWVNNQTGSPSRPLEFLPVVLYGNIISMSPFRVEIKIKNGDSIRYKGEDALNKLFKYGYCEFNESPNSPEGFKLRIDSEFRLFTNMRACLNFGLPYEHIPYNTPEELQEFKAVRVKAPMFVFNHLVTHTALSKEARSERVTALSGTDYWLPKDFRARVYDFTNKYETVIGDDLYMELVNNQGLDSETATKTINSVYLACHLLTYRNTDDVITTLVSGSRIMDLDYSQEAIQHFFKDLGYPKEIYQRAMLEFRYKEFILTGWYNNPNTWEHLFTERNANQEIWKNWTQSETQEVVSMIKEVILKQESQTSKL